jgi:hypothetical protein
MSISNNGFRFLLEVLSRDAQSQTQACHPMLQYHSNGLSPSRKKEGSGCCNGKFDVTKIREIIEKSSLITNANHNSYKSLLPTTNPWFNLPSLCHSDQLEIFSQLSVRFTQTHTKMISKGVRDDEMVVGLEMVTWEPAFKFCHFQASVEGTHPPHGIQKIEYRIFFALSFCNVQITKSSFKVL